MSGPYAPVSDQSAPQPAPLASITEAGGWSVPDGLAAEVAKQSETPSVDLDKPTTTDKLQQDVSPTPWPDGAPVLRPYHRLPRRERAEFMERLDPLWEKVQQLPKGGDSVGPKDAATMYRTLAEIEEFLRPLAEDAAEFDTWLAGPGADDPVFMQLFNAFFARSQPGEAASSSS